MRIQGLEPQEFAFLHCNKGRAACAWYHGSWHLLKSLGVVSTSAVHEEALFRLLTRALVDIDAPHILLTGSTDESLVRIVHHTCTSLNVHEKLHAVDVCATPLAFMQEYASNNGIALTTHQADILDFETSDHFDVVLTHAFMGYFDDEMRPILMAKWAKLLSDKGRIVTIQRVRPIESPKLVVFSETQASRFVEAAIGAAKSCGSEIDLTAVESAAAAFASNFSNYAIRSKSAFESLFADAGLVFDFLEYHKLKKVGSLSGPSVPSDAEFAHVIAARANRDSS
jgi:SAM-dependent methyltransferase